MELFIYILLALIFLERIAKHVLVLLFFGKAKPLPTNAISLVSILQPILSGDPTLYEGLETNIRHFSRYNIEYIWLVDEDDTLAKSYCQELINRYPEKKIIMVEVPFPEDSQNPKTVKLIAGSELAMGDVICILDDDTRLPDFGLDMCLPYLELDGVGLAFGLPYYVSFGNFWSCMVSYFVNSHSLLNYIPYSMLSDPFTINGMFYVIRREIFTKLGGFQGLEYILADDFAIAQRVRMNGYKLVQTPLLHGISTWVAGWQNYSNLIKRWFVFPRESIMRHLGGGERFLFYMIIVLPLIFPWLALSILFLSASYWPAILLYYIYEYIIFVHFNIKFFNGVSPWRYSFFVVLIEMLLPLQVIIAFILPQKIIWRGHLMQVEAKGRFKILARRNK